jgi:hypothetical protein
MLPLHLTHRLNQCVGELNYKYFMLFLLTNGAFFWYGAYLIYHVLVSEVSVTGMYVCDRDGWVMYALSVQRSSLCVASCICSVRKLVYVLFIVIREGQYARSGMHRIHS